MIKEQWDVYEVPEFRLISSEVKEFNTFADAMFAYAKEVDRLEEEFHGSRTLESIGMTMVQEEEINAFFENCAMN